MPSKPSSRVRRSIRAVLRRTPGGLEAARRLILRFEAWQHRRRLSRDLGYRFARIYRTGGFQGEESASGQGSSVAATEAIRAALPGLLQRLDVSTLLDIPCGDFNWMRQVDLAEVSYIGGDVVAHVIEDNQRHAGPNRRFEHLDLTRDPLPRADLVLVRDCLQHLSLRHDFEALQNLHRSGSTYLLTTTFPSQSHNRDIESGDWRVLNLERHPFHFPAPLESISEDEREERYRDKVLALWRLQDLGGHLQPCVSCDE